MRLPLLLLLCGGSACSGPSGPPGGASSSTADTSASAVPLAPSAASSVVEDDGPPGVRLEAALFAGHERLFGLAAVARPACRVTERIEILGKTVSRWIEVSSPSVGEAELAARLDRAASAMGLSVTEQVLLGKGVFDDATQTLALLAPTRVTVELPGLQEWRARGAELAKAGKFDAWSLVEELGEHVTWKTVAFSHHLAGSEMSLEADRTLEDPSARVATWVKRHRLEKKDDAWVRSHEPTGRNGIVVRVTAASLEVLETHGKGLGGPACAGAPASGPSARPEASADAGPREKLDADLMDEMMR